MDANGIYLGPGTNDLPAELRVPLSELAVAVAAALRIGYGQFESTPHGVKIVDAIDTAWDDLCAVIAVRESARRAWEPFIASGD